MPSKAVLLIDDHPVVALGVKLSLQDREGLSLVGTLADPARAMAEIERLAPDAVVLDLAFDGTVHLALIEKTRALLPNAAIVVFTSLPARLYKQQCLAAGANAFLAKDNDLDTLVAVLTRLCAQPVRPLRSADRVADAPPPRLAALLNAGANLTKREYEIAGLLSRGTSVAEIASLVGASENTVAVHRDNLRVKLGCRDSVELVARLARIYATSETLD